MLLSFFLAASSVCLGCRCGRLSAFLSFCLLALLLLALGVLPVAALLRLALAFPCLLGSPLLCFVVAFDCSGRRRFALGTRNKLEN